MRLVLFIALLLSFNGLSQRDTIIGRDTIQYFYVYGADRPGSRFCDKCLIEEGGMKDNRKEGTWKKYYANGQVRIVGTYQNNYPNGPYELYYENGVIKEKGTFFRRLYRDSLKRYYKSGCLRYIGHFNQAGREHGLQTYYKDNCSDDMEKGQLDHVYRAKNGTPSIDTVYTYYPNGDVLEIAWRKKGGEIIKETIFDRVNPPIKSEESPVGTLQEED